MERWELKQRQSLPLEAKINMSIRRIIDWYEYWGGDVYVSYSGGKDSTVLLDLVRQVYPDVEAVFTDTGLEYPEVRQMAKEYGAVFLKPTMSFRQVILKYGYPIASKEQADYISLMRKNPANIEAFHEWMSTGKASRPTYAFEKYILGKRGNDYTSFKISKKWYPLLDAPFNTSSACCAMLKKNPSKKYERQTRKHPFVGTLASEGERRMQNYLKNGCNAFEAKRPVSTPIAFWTENDVLEYIVAKNLKIASVYGDIVRLNDGTYTTTGCDRTGCMFCMFGCHLDKEPNRFKRLAKTHSKIYDYCMKPVENGGLGLAEVLDFINVPYK